MVVIVTIGTVTSVPIFRSIIKNMENDGESQNNDAQDALRIFANVFDTVAENGASPSYQIPFQKEKGEQYNSNIQVIPKSSANEVRSNGNSFMEQQVDEEVKCTDGVQNVKSESVREATNEAEQITDKTKQTSFIERIKDSVQENEKSADQVKNSQTSNSDPATVSSSSVHPISHKSNYYTVFTETNADDAIDIFNIETDFVDNYASRSVRDVDTNEQYINTIVMNKEALEHSMCELGKYTPEMRSRFVNPEFPAEAQEVFVLPIYF